LEKRKAANKLKTNCFKAQRFYLR